MTAHTRPAVPTVTRRDGRYAIVFLADGWTYPDARWIVCYLIAGTDGAPVWQVDDRTRTRRAATTMRTRVLGGTHDWGRRIPPTVLDVALVEMPEGACP